MGQHRQVLVTKDVNYGASKSSATAETALNPADLADGAIGIYGIGSEASSNNAGKLALITDGGSDAAGKIPAASFAGEGLFIAVGTPSGNPIVTNSFDLSAFKKIISKAYTAPVKGVITLGSTSSDTLNYASTILKGDEISITVTNREYDESGDRSPYEKDSYTYSLKKDESEYSALAGLVAKVSKRAADNPDVVLIAPPKIKSNLSGSAFANSATVAAVNGATSLTTSAAHGVGVDDYVSLDGDLYQAKTGTTGTTLVLDRPYAGPTGTIANGDTADLGATDPTTFALEITDKNFFMNNSVSVHGVIEDAVITQTTDPSPGSGSYDHIKRLEEEALPKKGSHDQINRYMPLDTIKAVEGATYDLYIMSMKNENHNTGEQGSVFNVVNYVYAAFPSGVANTSGKNQSNFEDVVEQLYSNLVSLF